MTPVVYDGKIKIYVNIPEAKINELIVAPLTAKGYDLPSSRWEDQIISLKVGDPVPNWDKYQVL